MTRFDYFYGAQADQFTFIRIPRALITDTLFAVLSAPAKLLYAMLLDRMSLSMRNGWFDDQNRAYIIYQIADIQKDLGFSKRKAMDYLTELVEFGLVEKIKRGFGMPSILYVKSFLSVVESDNAEDTAKDKEAQEEPETPKEETVPAESQAQDVKILPRDAEIGTFRGAEIDTSRSAEIDISRGAQIDTSRSAEIDTSRGAQIDTSEVRKSIPLNNKTNMNKTNNNYLIESYRIYDGEEDVIRSDVMMRGLSNLIKKNIGYDSLLEDYPYEKELVDGIYELILETVLSQSESILIASERYPAELVKSKFLKLHVLHIRYVIDCLHKNTTQVRNIKKYLLAALFNAPTTIEGYYKAAVNHDMPELAL